MNAGQTKRLEELLAAWTKRGPQALKPVEKEELIRLLIKKMNL